MMGERTAVSAQYMLYQGKGVCVYAQDSIMFSLIVSVCFPLIWCVDNNLQSFQLMLVYEENSAEM